VCEHKWTIVYIGNEPVGLSCSACEESRPVAKAETDPREFHIFADGIYEIPMPDGRRRWQLNQWEVYNSFRERSRLTLEFLEA
jgi:hypothetical protein